MTYMEDIIKGLKTFFGKVFDILMRIFWYIMRFLEFAFAYIIPSFIISYITMYIPEKESWNVLCVFAFIVATAINSLTSWGLYRTVDGNLKRYSIITYTTYAAVCGFSFLLYFYAETNLMLYTFTNAALRCLEPLLKKTIWSMLICHGINIIVITVVPMVLNSSDKKKAAIEAEVVSAQEEFDTMGMVFSPDELPDLPEEPIVIPKSEEESQGLLFDPDELPDPVEPEEVASVEDDEEEIVGLLFDPDEMPSVTEVKENTVYNSEEEAVGLLFDPDELPDPVSDPEDISTVSDTEESVGLLFDPDELPAPVEMNDKNTTDNEEHIGLLFNPDELPDFVPLEESEEIIGSKMPWRKKKKWTKY